MPLILMFLFSSSCMLESSITEQQVSPHSVDVYDRASVKKCCCSVLANLSSNMCLLYYSNLRLPTSHFMNHFMLAFHSERCWTILQSDDDLWLSFAGFYETLISFYNIVWSITHLPMCSFCLLACSSLCRARMN